MVRVDKFLFLVDFMVIDINEKLHTQLILGRPFIATSGALIDILEGTVTLRVRDDKVALDVLACND